MDFICITRFHIRLQNPEAERLHTINEIRYDIVKEIETQTPIPFELFGKFGMCEQKYIVVDILRRIELNTDLGRVEHITNISLSYESDVDCIESYVPF